MNRTQLLKITREEMFVRFVVLLSCYVIIQVLRTELQNRRGLFVIEGKDTSEFGLELFDFTRYIMNNSLTA